MSELTLTQIPKADTAMLIRRPAKYCFEAFADPEITTQFWFTKSSGRLEEGLTIRWDWEMYGVGTDVFVKQIVPNERIVIEWDGVNGRTEVTWNFRPHAEGTFVEVTDSGFTGTGDEVAQQAIDSTQGFSLVLAGAKALLEHRVKLNLVPDRYPPGLD